MKFPQIFLLILLAASVFQCKPTKIISINTELAIIKATKKPQLIKRIPGALLQFIIVSNKEIELTSVKYWEQKESLKIVKKSNDTIWAEAQFRKPNLQKESIESNTSMSSQKPIDSTCIILYKYKEDNLELIVPKLKLLKVK
jgi:hypothetical protein